MPVTDELRAIAERADRELDAVHDFFEHSKIVWRSFQILVGEGHKVSYENLIKKVVGELTSAAVGRFSK
jgi:hypothetical protein